MGAHRHYCKGTVKPKKATYKNEKGPSKEKKGPHMDNYFLGFPGGGAPTLAPLRMPIYIYTFRYILYIIS